MARASGSGRRKEYEWPPIQEVSPKWEGMPKGQAVAEESRARTWRAGGGGGGRWFSRGGVCWFGRWGRRWGDGVGGSCSRQFKLSAWIFGGRPVFVQCGGWER